VKLSYVSLSLTGYAFAVRGSITSINAENKLLLPDDALHLNTRVIHQKVNGPRCHRHTLEYAKESRLPNAHLFRKLKVFESLTEKPLLEGFNLISDPSSTNKI